MKLQANDDKPLMRKDTNMEQAYEVVWMPKWKMAPNYLGEDLTDWFIILQGSDKHGNLIDQTNYEVGKERLGEHVNEDYILDAQFGSWAGSFKLLMVHQDAPDEVLELCDTIRYEVENYIILDEDLFCEREQEALDEYWSILSVAERLDLIRRHNNSAPFGHEVSMFAARQDDRPTNLEMDISVDEL